MPMPDPGVVVLKPELECVDKEGSPDNGQYRVVDNVCLSGTAIRNQNLSAFRR